MLDVEAIETRYGASQVLFGVSFGVRAGEVVTLLGRNGMGKTTTVRSIMGIVPPKAGAVSFDGKPLGGLPSYRIAQAGIGLVPEGRQVFPNLTVRENLVATAANRGRGPILDAGEGVCDLSAACRAPAQHTATSSPAASSRCSRSAAR